MVRSLDSIRPTRRQWNGAWWLFIGTLLAGTFIPSAFADVISVVSTADAGIEQGLPSVNFGSSVTAVSGKLGANSSGEIRHALFKFDLSGKVPAGALINSVSLQVQVVRVPQSPANSIFDLRRLLQDWGESAVTWNSRLTGVTWQTPGATGSADCQLAASSSVFVSDVGIYTFPSTPNLVADVQSWVNDPTSNFGWLLISEDEVTLRTARHFATRESGATAPVLTIDYSLAAPVILSQPQSQTVSEGSDGVLFSVTAAGASPLTYQWQFNGSNLSSATNSTLILNNVSTNDAGSYTVTVTNPGGSTNSQPALLTVQPTVFPPPTVAFLTPTNGQKFAAHSDVIATVQASASSNGLITRVDFLLNTTLIGSLTNSPFTFLYTNLPAGTNQLIARVTDSRGASNSALVQIVGLPSPTVAITAPSTGSRFLLGTNVPIQLTVPNNGVPITSVLLFANGAQLTSFNNPPYTFNWIPTQAQDYILTAIATDELGQSGTSAPVSVRIFIADSVLPSVRITEMPPHRVFVRSNLLAGTAADNIGLDRVEIQLNGRGYQPASGIVSWDAPLLFDAGLNTVQVRSVDLAGNTSPVLTRYFTYVVQLPVTIQSDPPGQGTITPDLNNQLLEIGKIYTLKATPASGQIFNGWTGVPLQQGPVLNFVMQSNVTLITARFMTNPFIAVQGDYSGLILNSNAPAPESSGYLNFRVLNSGRFSGTLTSRGKRYPLHGQFDAGGNARFAVLRPSMQPIALTLLLDLTNSTQMIQGTATDGQWTSPLLCYRNPFTPLSNPAPAAGSYSFVLELPGGAFRVKASGNATVSTGGNVIFRGTLQDGNHFSFTTTTTLNGDTPFYLSTSSGPEIMIGRIHLAPSPPKVDGNIYWVRSGSGGFISSLIAVPVP